MAFSTQESSSSSTPVVTETPENQIIDQISGVASGLAGQMYNWAQGVFAQTSAVTDQAIGNFFNVSQQMLGLSNNLTSQYNNLFAPENKQLVQDANSYASPARMAVDMGQAGATQAQAGDAALRNSEEALRSYGIDPSSGRYAALDKAAAVQNAANVAGAENTQRNADIATGQRLRSEAVQVGATLPAAIANINNTAIQANTGASNASLANANTGANLMHLPNDYLKTAMDVKLPLQGQNSSSRSTGMSTSPDRSDSSGGNRGPGNGSGSGSGSPSGPAWMPNHTGYQTDNTGYMARGNAQPSSGIMHLPGDSGGGNPNDWMGQSDWDPAGLNSGTSADNFTDPFGGGSGSMDVGQAGTNDNLWNQGNGAGFGDSNPFSDSGFGQTFDYGGSNQGFNGLNDMGNSDMGFGNISYDPGANQAQLPDGWSDPSSGANTNWGNGADQYGGYDTSNSGSDFYAGDYTAPSDNYDPGGAFAAGGPVPRSMSPSGGQRVDDVQAQGPGGSQLNLNADEFVIPRDVALWKGQEFFQTLIDQSRKKRMTAPAKPSAGPPPQAPMR